MLVLDEDVLPFKTLHELQLDDIDGNINAVMMNLSESDKHYWLCKRYWKKGK